MKTSYVKVLNERTNEYELRIGSFLLITIDGYEFKDDHKELEQGETVDLWGLNGPEIGIALTKIDRLLYV